MAAGSTHSSRLTLQKWQKSSSEDIKFLHALVDKLKEQGSVSIPNNSTIEDRIERLIEGKTRGLTAVQRQELVRKTIGEDDYSVLHKVLAKSLSSSDVDQQGAAVSLLGYPLFDMDAADQLKALVFHPNRSIQYLAVKSLVCLDVPGASTLLVDMVLAGVVNDYDQAAGINALYLTNDKALDSVATALLQRKLGGATFESLVPVLKKRPDYREILCRVFKSNMFLTLDQEDLPLEQQVAENAEHFILQQISADTSYFMTDADLKKKVVMYAGANHNDLFTVALVILEKSGQDLEFFTGMRKDSRTTPEKKKILDLIIPRIQSGQRLK